jgi:hypothetical protein
MFCSQAPSFYIEGHVLLVMEVTVYGTENIQSSFKLLLAYFSFLKERIVYEMTGPSVCPATVQLLKQLP